MALRRTASEDAEIVEALEAFAAKTVILDVEPFITHWHSDDSSFDASLASSLDCFRSMKARPSTVVVATNSRRRLRGPLAGDSDFTVVYVSRACKPLRLSFYRDLPRPGVVVGDQVATDGMLAVRLGYDFVHYRPLGVTMPGGPRLMRWLGYPLQQLYFRDSRS